MTDLWKGETAKTIFERAQLPNELLGRIWNLADTEQKGALGLTEFIIAMHLLTSFKNGSMRALPQILPAGLYEAAARRGPPRQGTGSRPTSNSSAAIPRQFSGQGVPVQARPSQAGFQSPMQTGDQWLVTPQDKAQFDSIFSTVDTQNRGFVTGDQAVTFFSNSRLPEEALAQIWDLADINSHGQLSRDEFAVAMYLIRQQRAKRDGRDVLPQSLPRNLVPPSMHRQTIPPPQPTAPAFDNAANITKPKSASEDLFGLDAIYSTPPTENKAAEPIAFTPTSPTRSQTSPAPTLPSQPPSHFKPFVPSSSFGQTIMTPQQTGTSSPGTPTQNRSVPSTAAQKHSAMDDLLGDNDPEVSKRLTNETSELANLSNQVGTLTNQMSQVKTNRAAVEQSLGQAQEQKREFEARLAQLRTAYQQEVKEVQALEERLRISKEETKKLQSDMALIQGTHEDLQNQRRQAAEALEADQTENVRLKERISQTNSEISELKPRLEKAKLDARQQKGLVAIYKKQLAGNENEKEKIMGDLDGAVQEHGEATRDLEETKKAVEAKTQISQSASAAVASPPLSSGSMNPFFRRSSTTTDKAVASPFMPPNVASPNHNAFDSFFGPSAPAASGPPSTSFKTDTPPVVRESADTQQVTSQTSSDGTGVQTPSASPPPSSFGDSPQTATEPPAPPQSRQITSSFLPLRPNLDHSGSESSSVKVIPPASRMGGGSVSGADTPTLSGETATPMSPKQHLQDLAVKGSAATVNHAKTPAPNAGTSSDVQVQETNVPPNLTSMSGSSSASRDLPGAFPGDESDRESHAPPFAPATVSGASGLDPRVDSIPSTTRGLGDAANAAEKPSHKLTTSPKSEDFDSAFASFSEKDHGSSDAYGADKEPKMKAKDQSEFPPIRELGVDEESDSEEENGFADNFTQDKGKALSDLSGNKQRSLAPTRPPFASTESNQSQLPTPGAQASPPSYDQTFGSVGTTTSLSDRKDSNQFPAEYNGLLPSRENPTSSPSSPPVPSSTANSNITSSAGIDRGLNFFPSETTGTSSGTGAVLGKSISPMSPGASTAAPFAYSHTSPPPNTQHNPPIPPKTGGPKDEFEDEFGDLTEAKEASDHGEEDMSFSHNPNSDLDDFNPIFDSPATSRFAGKGSQSSNLPQTDSFANFEAAPATGSFSNAGQGSAVAQQASSHDWDAIFAGLDSPQTKGVGADMDFSPSKPHTGSQRNGAASEGQKSISPSKPPAFSDDTSDDPILKRLTGMGYPRDQSLAALEKYDYNIDKVSCPARFSRLYVKASCKFLSFVPLAYLSMLTFPIQQAVEYLISKS